MSSIYPKRALLAYITVSSSTVLSNSLHVRLCIRVIKLHKRHNYYYATEKSAVEIPKEAISTSDIETTKRSTLESSKDDDDDDNNNNDKNNDNPSPWSQSQGQRRPCRYL